VNAKIVSTRCPAHRLFDLKVGPVCYSQSKSIYSEAFLKVDQFKRDQEFYSLKYKKTKNSFHGDLFSSVVFGSYSPEFIYFFVLLDSGTCQSSQDILGRKQTRF